MASFAALFFSSDGFLTYLSVALNPTNFTPKVRCGSILSSLVSFVLGYLKTECIKSVSIELKLYSKV